MAGTCEEALIGGRNVLAPTDCGEAAKKEPGQILHVWSNARAMYVQREE